MKLLLLLVPMAIAPALADEPLSSTFSQPVLQNYRAQNIWNAAIIGSDQRRNATDFAAEMDLATAQIVEVFGASGTLSCPGMQVTAQLTGANDVLTTAAHVFYDRECTFKGATGCVFRPLGGGAEFGVDPSSLKDGGCDAGGTDASLDWATIKLGKPVEGVTPYQLPIGIVGFREGQNILQVSAGDDTFHDASIPNFQACTFRGINAFRNVPIQTDCDTGSGSSGAAQLSLLYSGAAVTTENLTLWALNVGETLALPDGSAFDGKGSGGHFNKSVPVYGAFLDAIRANME